VSSNKLSKKEVQKFVKGHGNENKGKKTSPTCQGAPNLVECTLKNSCKAPKTDVQKFSLLEVLRSSKMYYSSSTNQSKTLSLSKHTSTH
jgi:hypothetical protein